MSKRKNLAKKQKDSRVVDKVENSGIPQEVRGDIITVSHVSGHAAVAAGRRATAEVRHNQPQAEALAAWSQEILNRIDRDEFLDSDEKASLKTNVKKIEKEAANGKKADTSRLSKWLNVIAVMAPDIFEVAFATLVNPAAGLGLVVKKIGDRAEVELQS